MAWVVEGEMEIIVQMKVVWGIIELQSRLMEVKYDLIGGLSMKRIVIVGILVIWLILLAMWFLTTGSPT